MTKAVDHTDYIIKETIACLQRVESYNKSIDKYTWVKVTDKIELDSLFGLIKKKILAHKHGNKNKVN